MPFFVIIFVLIFLELIALIISPTFKIKQASPFAKQINAVIVIGCVIQGDTPHFDYVCQSVTQGVTILNAGVDAWAAAAFGNRAHVPVIFSVLTVLNQQQALDRCGGKLGNKGVEGAYTAMRMANL